MSDINSNQLLTEMKIMASRANGTELNAEPLDGQAGEFGAMLKKALDQVNEHQIEASDLAERFEAGDESVDLAQVMISLQKSNISLQTMAQVRNRLVSAYQEIMNMPI